METCMRVKEWSAGNEYNEFNSAKGLTYYREYQSILNWMDGRGKPLPAIECSFDPITLCNLKCYYCNSQRYIENYQTMSLGHMRKVIDFLSAWGTRGLCLGGGGESLLNKDAWDLPSYAVKRGLEPCIITNGTVMNETIIANADFCKWMAFSVDAATPETFQRIKGVDLFNLVLANIGKVAHRTRVAYRVLLTHDNEHEIYAACKIAKETGCDTFHVRPVDLGRPDYNGSRKLELNIESVLEQYQRCHELETDTFKVQTVMHKFNFDLTPKHHFKKCLASPICLQACTDGYCYVCPDHRMEERFRLGSQDSIEEWWGSDKHRHIVQSIEPDKECSRCTWSEYQKQIEDVAILDRMNRNFP